MFTFDDLVQSLEGRRRLGEDPPVLLLGAGASASAGLATMHRLYEAEGIPSDAADAFEQFCAHMRKRDDRERFRWLAMHLQRPDAQQVTPGYQALAALCAQHIFDVVLTANLDPLLEDAFTATSLKRRDYLVLVNGVLRMERLPLLLLPGAPRVKVLKLHGDLFHRFMAWTPEEMDTYLRDVTPALSKGLAMRDVLVVGYSLRDPAVRALALGTGGTVWFANPRPPAADIAEELAKFRVRVITSAQCEFEPFFSSLASALAVESEGAAATTRIDPARVPPPRDAEPDTAMVSLRELTSGKPPVEAADNLDEVLAATIGIVTGGEPGYVAFTGFLLADPRVIVTDGWVADQLSGGPPSETFRIVTQAGERLQARRLALVDGNPFGPLLLEAPRSLEVAGLRLDTTPLAADERIDVAVGTSLRRAIFEGAMTVDAALEQKLIDKTTASRLRRALRQRKKLKDAGSGLDAEWQRFAIGHGRVRTGQIESLMIAPIGQVGQMVQLELATGPGSSGGPMVDATCAVRGFIVAGSTDPARPDSYALAASWWGPRVRELI